MVNDQQSRPEIFDRGSLIILLGLVSLMPLIIVPGLGLSLDLTKRLVLIVGAGALALIWLIGRLIDRKFSAPKNWLYPAFGLVWLTTILAALFSGDIYRSLVGFGYERDTVLALSVFGLLFIFTSLYIKTKERALLSFLMILAASDVTALFQISQIGFINLAGFSFLPGGAFNLVGKWNEIGFFWGFAVCLALALLELLPWRSTRSLKLFLWLTIILSLVGVTVVNGWIIWLLIGLFSLTLVFYRRIVSRRFAWLPFGLLIIALAIVLIGRPPAGKIYTVVSSNNARLGINSLEVSPSWSGTWTVLLGTLKDRPIFGAGPNTFAVAWNRFKPAGPGGVNETPFWNVDFNNGIGFLPTLAVTTGVVGIFAWLVFFILFLYYGSRALSKPETDETNQTFAAITFLATAYLWTTLFLYPPDTVLLTLAFFFTGALVAMLAAADLTPFRDWSWADDPRFSFTGALAAILLVIVVIGGLYFTGERFVSALFFAQGLQAGQNGNLARAETLVSRAAQIAGDEIFFRSLVEIKLAALSQLLARQDLKPEEALAQLEVIVRGAIAAGQEATERSSSNYLNWLSLGRVYESLVPLKIEGAYPEAVRAYDLALSLNPTNPGILLDQARLEITVQNQAKARELINRAIALKPNYTEAIFLLAQLDAQSGNLQEAIRRSEEAATLSPGDPVVFFQLGFLRYQAGGWRGAVEALKRAVELNPNYANARYFLGLAYDALGEADRALIEFETITRTNPDNQELIQIITNLRAGRRALVNTEPPPPKDRKNLPVKEDN